MGDTAACLGNTSDNNGEELSEHMTGLVGFWHGRHVWCMPHRGLEDRCARCGLTKREAMEYVQLLCPGFTKRGAAGAAAGVIGGGATVRERILFQAAPLQIIRRG